MRFFMLVFGLLAALAAMYFMILFWGLGRTLPHFEHPFSKLEFPQAAAAWDSAIWATAPPEQSKRLIFWIDVYRAQDGRLRVLPSALRPEPQEVLPKNLGDEGPLAKELLQGRNSDQPVVLNVLSNVDGIDLQLHEELKDLALQRVLVQSEFDNVMTAIKKLQPMWIYGTSASDRVRWNMFASLGLAPAVTFTGDIYVSPLKVRNLDAMNSAILNEVRRRGMLLLMGPLGSVDEVRQAQAYYPDIYFVTSLDAFAALPGF